MSASPAYIYRDAVNNLIVGLDIYKNLTHKTENRLRNENSEDAVSWNVFVGLLALGGLRTAFKCLTGFDISERPRLYLWGNCIGPDTVEFWDRLRYVQREIEPKKKFQPNPI
jgi:hypothetical protein